jgi:AAA+ ATPase superfamily predicted ATPase
MIRNERVARVPSGFVDRDVELAAINRALVSNRAELVIVYGRRGAGKSELLVRALEGRPGFYYQATAEVMAQQLADLAAELQHTAPELVVGQFASSAAFLDALAMLVRANPNHAFPVVLDEFPYLADAEPGFETVVQRWWDRNHRSLPNLKLFLAGSQVSWMQEHTLAEHGPLQNRRTSQIEILPLTYRYAAQFYPHLDAADRVRAYGVWGGLPGYLRELDATRSLGEMIAQTMLRPEARLAVEPDWLRFTDLRADRLYTSLVRAVAMGARRPSDIARAVGRGGAAEVMPALNRLIEAGVIERVAALASRDSGRVPTRYELVDPFLAFWYRFIDPRRGAIRRVRTEDASLAIAGEIVAGLDDYVARRVFEGICREWVWDVAASGTLSPGLRIGHVGTWWSGRDEAQDEIDVVALSPEREGVLYGECKWSVAPMDVRDLGGLRAAIAAASHAITPIDRPWRVLFSRSGFHPDVQATAAAPENRIILVDLDQLYR